MKKTTLSYILLLFFAFIGYLTVSESQPVTRLSSLLVSETRAPSTLGVGEVGQRPGIRSADRNHLAVRYQDGAWQIANISPDKKVDIKTDKRNTLFLKRLPLEKNDEIQLGHNLLKVTAVSVDSISLTSSTTGNNAEWRNGELFLNGQTVYPAGWWNLFKQRQRWNFRSFKDQETLFSLGGSINLHNQWAMKGVPPKGAWIVWSRGRFFLAPGEERKALLHKYGVEAPLTFHDQWLPIDGAQGKVLRLVIGKTYYTVKPGEKTLELIPVSKIDVFSSSEKLSQLEGGLTATYAAGSWIGSGKPLLEWIADHKMKTSVGLLPGIFLAILIWHFTSYYETRAHYSLYLSCVFFSALFLTKAAGTSIDILWMLGLCLTTWVWATWTLFANNKLNKTAGWIWILAIFLAGSGVILHLQLFAGADNTRWGMFAWKQAFYVSICGWAIGILGNIPGRTLLGFVSLIGDDNRFTRVVVWLRFFVYLFVIVLLLAMAIRGDEQGFGVFQPSELMKLVLVVLAAFTAMDFWDIRSNPAMSRKRHFSGKLMRILDMGFILALMTITAIVSLVWIKDISPVLIILAFLLFWLWKISTSNRDGRKQNFFTAQRCIRSGILLTILIIIIAAYSIYTNPQNWTRLPQHDRFATWSEPERHPYSGAQVIKAMRLAGHGGWFGAEGSWFGLNEDGNDLPAVQDDFALSFFLYKFGAVAGIALLCVQLCYLFLLSRAGSKALFLSGDYAKRQAGIVLCFVIQGLVVIHILQWSISWGNTLGLLPVMGQPMTWLSSGNSHLASVGFTALILGLLGCWVTEYVDRHEK